MIQDILPVSKLPAFKHAIPQAAITPAVGKPHFSDNSRARDHFSATTKASRSLRKLDSFGDSIGSNVSQRFWTIDRNISACANSESHSAEPPRT